MSNRHPNDGKPYYCVGCGAMYGGPDCPDRSTCGRESEHDAQARRQKWLNAVEGIKSLKLPTRIQRALEDGGVHRLRELIEKTASELLMWPNIGSLAVARIRSALQERGLDLKTEPDQPNPKIVRSVRKSVVRRVEKTTKTTLILTKGDLYRILVNYFHLDVIHKGSKIQMLFADEFDTRDADLEWTKDDDPFIKLLTETHEEESSED